MKKKKIGGPVEHGKSNEPDEKTLVEQWTMELDILSDVYSQEQIETVLGRYTRDLSIDVDPDEDFMQEGMDPTPQLLGKKSQGKIWFEYYLNDVDEDSLRIREWRKENGSRGQRYPTGVFV